MSEPFRFDVVSLFGDLVTDYTAASILGRATAAGLIDVQTWDPREYTDDRHRTVDDHPFGGGAGLVMKAEPLFRAISACREARDPARVVLLSPAGRRFDHDVAAEYAALGSLALVCGRYEGIDERVAAHVVDEELSIGDFVLTGGEVAAMAVIDAVARLRPGVLGNAEGAAEESFVGAERLLEHPQYTRPRLWRDHEVPEVLLSGDHGRIAAWRLAQRQARTAARRPDLLATDLPAALSTASPADLLPDPPADPTPDLPADPTPDPPAPDPRLDDGETSTRGSDLGEIGERS